MYRLVDTFQDFLQQQQLDIGIGSLFKSSMPKRIAVCHTIDVFEKIVMNDFAENNST